MNTGNVSNNTVKIFSYTSVVGNRGRKRKHRRRNEGNPPARREEYGDPDNIGMSTEEAKAEVATVEELGPASTSSMIEFLSSQDFCCGDDGGFVSEDGLWGATDTSAVAELVGVYGGGGTKSSAVSTSAVDIAASVSLPTTTDLSTGRRTGPPLFRVVGTSTADAPSGEDISRAEGDVAWENIEVSIDPLDDPTSAIAEPEMFVIGRRGATVRISLPMFADLSLAVGGMYAYMSVYLVPLELFGCGLVSVYSN